MALPLIALFLLFYIVPLAGSLRYSFTESAFSARFVGLKNYIETISNRNFRLSVKNTAQLLVIGVPLLIGISLLLALLMQRAGERLEVLRCLLVLPMLLPSAAVADVFGKMGAYGARLPVIMIYIWKNAGFLMILFLAAFSMIPREIYEAAALDGAGRARMFFSFTLPLIVPSLLFAVLLAMAYNLRLFREAYLLYGAYPAAEMYLTQHYMNNHFEKLNYQKLTTAASLFFAALFVVVGAGVRIAEKRKGEG